jgi:hypothetical protein
MSPLDAFAEWLKATPLSYAATHFAWLWPVCQILHFVGLVMLVGTVGALDLRLLGVGKGVRIGSIARMVPVGLAGFALNFATGIVFVAGDPPHYLHNPAFQWKLAFIALAGVNVGIFKVSGLERAVEAIGLDGAAPMGARVVAALSLFLWVGVMYLGRMLPFLGNSF